MQIIVVDFFYFQNMSHMNTVEIQSEYNGGIFDEHCQRFRLKKFKR